MADPGGFLEFLKQVFDAEETERVAGSDGRIRHAEARIGNSKVMIGEATEQWRGKPNAVYVYVADVDATYRQGSRRRRAHHQPAHHAFLRRSKRGIEDSEGNTWWIASRVEDVTAEELQPGSRARARVESVELVCRAAGRASLVTPRNPSTRAMEEGFSLEGDNVSISYPRSLPDVGVAHLTGACADRNKPKTGWKCRTCAAGTFAASLFRM